MSDGLQLESPWPHRWAVVLVCATFPLIWVGGLVTTYDAGMAVPDWPTTFGYNLFLYPWQTWVAGPWDVFVEHGHRLLGSLAGMLTIALVVAVWRGDNRRWQRGLACGALALVIFQGALGGARVIQDERLLAKIHACLGPAFFALAMAIAVFTSQLWKDGPRIAASPFAGKLHRLAIFTAALAYCQLILGANLRHIAVTASIVEFRAALVFHLVGAAVLVVHVLLLAAHVWRRFRTERVLRRPASLLGIAILAQIVLGAGSWLVKYAVPQTFDWIPALQGMTIENEGLVQSMTVTAHTAGGSLILATSVALALRSLRLVPSGATAGLPGGASIASHKAVEAVA